MQFLGSVDADEVNRLNGLNGLNEENRLNDVNQLRPLARRIDNQRVNLASFHRNNL